MADDAHLIDRFVGCFVQLDGSVFSHSDPPLPEFSAGIDPDDWNVIRWHPAAISTSPDALEAIRCCGVLPTLYEQLVLSYRWPEIDIGVCCLLPNQPADDLQPLADSMFGDPVLNNTLIPNGFARFALAANDYAPICFDLNRSVNGDCPIVRLNHESILMHDSIGNVTTVFDAFRGLMQAVLAMDALR